MGSYLAHGPEIYPKAHENPRAVSCIFGPIFLECSIQCPWGIGLHQSKCKNRYLKVLGPLTEQIDAIKDVYLIKDVFVFYAEGASTKHRCLVSLA